MKTTLRYQYRAATAGGRPVEGTLEARSERMVIEELRRQHLHPVEIALAGGIRGRRALRQDEALSVFTRMVATMVGAGVSLDRAIEFAAEQASHPSVARAAHHVCERLRSGSTIEHALSSQSEVFGPLFVSMVSAGEESGALDEALTRLADHVEEVADRRAQIRTALIYPSLMGLVTAAGILILLMFVIPRFAAILGAEGQALPLSARILVGVSAFVVAGWPFLLVAGLSLSLGARRWFGLQENRRRWHKWRLTWPLVGEFELSRATALFARALGMLLRSGTPVLPSLRAARGAVSNLELSESLKRAEESVSHGIRVHVALSGTLPALACELIAVGEESGSLEKLCSRIAEAYDAEVRRTLRSLVAIVEPGLILVFGVIVGFVALAMLQAIYGIDPSTL